MLSEMIMVINEISSQNAPHAICDFVQITELCQNTDSSPTMKVTSANSEDNSQSKKCVGNSLENYRILQNVSDRTIKTELVKLC